MTASRTPRRAAAVFALALAWLAPGACLAQPGSEPLHLLCSVREEWCSLIATTFSRISGAKVTWVQRSTGDALAQLIAERANPKVDVWFGGTGDPHLQAAEMGLTLAYKSPSLPMLRLWAQAQAKQSNWHTVGVYMGPLGIAVNTEALARRNLATPRCWKDLLQPGLRGEVQVSHPGSSGTAYTMVATLVQMMGEDKAFDYLKELHRNVGQYTRSGSAPLRAVAREEALASVSFLQDVPAEQLQGAPVEGIVPCEGTGAEIGSMSLIKGGPHGETARKFYEWALTPGAQQFGQTVRQFHVPSHRDTPMDPRMPTLLRTRLVNYDYVKYGSVAERQRLISRWEREVPAAAR